MQEKYFVYITTNKWNRVLYTGVTKNITRRITEHKYKLSQGFTARYNAGKLVYFEEYSDPRTAIAREKQIKAGSRLKKLRLIWSINPKMEDLAGFI